MFAAQDGLYRRNVFPVLYTLLGGVWARSGRQAADGRTKPKFGMLARPLVLFMAGAVREDAAQCPQYLFYTGAIRERPDVFVARVSRLVGFVYTRE